MFKKNKSEKIAFAITIIIVVFITTMTNIPDIIRNKIERALVRTSAETGSYCYRSGECHILVKGDNEEYFSVLVNGDEEMIDIKWELAPVGFNSNSPDWDNYEYIWWSANLPPEYGDRYVIPEL